MELTDNLEIYPAYLRPIRISTQSEIDNVKRFMGYDDIKPGEYILCAMVVGDKVENWHQIIPVGEITQIALVHRNTVKYIKDVAGVFDFKLSGDDYYNKRNHILDWFYNEMDK